ncbi:MAG: DUF6591 domain-containing protein [Porcipelethomonas sp.]
MSDVKSMKSVVCSRCGGSINVDTESETVVCQYCGVSYPTSELLGDSDAVRIEKIRLASNKDIEFEKMRYESEKEKRQDEKESLQNFKKSKFSKILIIFAVISVLFCVLSFSNGWVLSGICAAIQAVLYISAWLIGSGVIKVKKLVYYIMIIAALLLIIPFFALKSNNFISNRSEEFDWNDIVLGSVLPKPESDEGEIFVNSAERLSMDVCESSLDNYKKYLEECENKGFILESEKGTNSYSAFNEDGYSLDLRYYEHNSEISIQLDAPREYSSISWPSLGIAAELPEPESKIGVIDVDASNEFRAEISETSEEEYNNYINKCMEKGFSVDYNKGDKLFEAYNEKGDSLAIRYEGFNVMSISVSAGEAGETAKETQVETEAKTESEITEKAEEEQDTDKSYIGSVSPEFKATMDSYEEFFDEYISFMKKYSESNYSLDMLEDYTDYMGKYAEMFKKLDEIDEDELSESDYLYYIEVQSRITQKLLEADV